jgi:hypothetical protein
VLGSAPKPAHPSRPAGGAGGGGKLKLTGRVINLREVTLPNFGPAPTFGVPINNVGATSGAGQGVLSAWQARTQARAAKDQALNTKAIQQQRWADFRDQLQQFQDPLSQQKSPAQLYQEMKQDQQTRDQLQALLKAVQENYQLQNRLFNDMMAEAVPALLDDLRSDDPLTRFLAVHAVGKRRLHLEKTLVGLLADPVPEVRQAARGALARLSRGCDFGPLPSAGTAQVTMAQSVWTEWLLMQDPPAQSDEPMSPRPEKK